MGKMKVHTLTIQCFICPTDGEGTATREGDADSTFTQIVLYIIVVLH